MKITERKLRKLIQEELFKEYGNPPPGTSSNWRAFSDAIDVGVLDLDEIAWELGFRDFYDMDISITPRVLSQRDPESFAVAVQNHSSAAADLSIDEILAIATADPGALDKLRY